MRKRLAGLLRETPIAIGCPENRNFNLGVFWCLLVPFGGLVPVPAMPLTAFNPVTGVQRLKKCKLSVKFPLSPHIAQPPGPQRRKHQTYRFWSDFIPVLGWFSLRRPAPRLPIPPGPNCQLSHFRFQ